MQEQAEVAQDQAEVMEQALAQTERDADAALRAADRLMKGLRQLKHAAQQGEVRRLRGSAEPLRQSLLALQEQIENAATSWDFDEENYLREGLYAQELLRRARAQGVDIREQDDRLYCYPMLITVDPTRRAVLIDRKLERRLRPSTLVGLLKERQQEPPRFRPARFLETLYAAYKVALAQEKREEGAVIRLVNIYALLTLNPDVGYARPEFTRDVHLLDISGENTTRNGAVVSFDASTSIRSGRDVLSIVAKNGAERRYYGVSFSKPSRD